MSDPRGTVAVPLPFVKRTLPPFAAGTIDTPAGKVFRIATAWSREDRWGAIRSRVSAYRMSYTVAPGLYAVGQPGPAAPVLVSANYKLSFDVLRRALDGLDGWVLVLDTKGINVWCAAGKGTFGTDELVRRVKATGLEKVVSHRRLIVPQLGAPGVSASAVTRETGFRVAYGPVEARDLPAYLAAGGKKTREMSVMRFSLLDRLVLTPMEINPAMKRYRWVALAIVAVFGLQPTGLLFAPAWSNGMPLALFGLLAVLAGALVTPVLLPWVPFRSFAIKGWLVGAATLFLADMLFETSLQHEGVLRVAAYLLFPALSSYIALQFTGSTTFTGMSGVKKELRIGLPLYGAAVAVSLALVIVFKLREWEVW